MKKFIVIGLGISGISTIKFLLEHNHQILAYDDSASSLNNLAQEFEKHPLLAKNLKICCNIDEIDLKDVEYVILSPGIPLKYPKPHQIVQIAKKNNIKLICDLELLYMFNDQAKYIGITGTNGKSTTTTLVGHIFKESKSKSAIGGNIGVPAFDLPEFKNDGTYILEISSYQLDLIDEMHFHIASLTNITPDHLDRHKDMHGYVEAKKRIFLNQKEGDFSIINIDNENTQKIYQELINTPNFKAKIIPISTKKILPEGVSVLNNIIYNNLGKGSQIILEDLPYLKGEHNAQNIAVAFANCFLSKINENEIIKALSSFKGLKHRMQLVGNIDNINFINDSKATNAEAAENSLKTYDNIYWILGGRQKEGGINELEPYFSKIKYAFLIGESSDYFAKTLDGKVPYHTCGDLDNAFKTAYEIAILDRQENNILLSPACSSFDQWINFEKRGDYFCELVNNLKSKKT